MVGPDSLLPAELKRTVEAAVAPGGGQVVEIVPVDDASCRVKLDERPVAVSVEEKEPFAANVVNVQDNARVVGDPSRKPWELGRLVKVLVTWEHRVVGRGDIEGRDIDRIGVSSGFNGVPLC
jgi:hypothetical protein